MKQEYFRATDHCDGTVTANPTNAPPLTAHVSLIRFISNRQKKELTGHARLKNNLRRMLLPIDTV